MDEIFTGLDPKSLVKAQTILKKHLPDTTMIVVDHHAKEHNDHGFYDSRIHFEDQTCKELVFG